MKNPKLFDLTRKHNMSAPQTILHHRVLPSSSNSVGYFPNQTVDFILQVPQRKLLSGSIRIEGTVTVTKGATVEEILVTDNCKLDNMVGAHSFFDQMSTEVESKGMLETLQNYPRYISMQSKASMSQDDMCVLSMGAELRGPKNDNGKYALQAVVERSDDGVGTGTETSPSSFSFKPMVCFNRSQGNMYSFDKMGFIRVSCILARNADAFFGKDVFGAAGVNCQYTLKDLALRFVTIPEDGESGPQLMRSYISTVNSVQSTSSSLVSRVPSSRVNGVAVSFCKQTDLQSPDANSLALQTVPDFLSTEYLFSNSVNQNITYTIKDRSDAIARGIQALSDSGHHQASIQTLQSRNGFLLGVPFGQFIDLSQQLFSMRLDVTSTTITSTPLSAFSMFSTLIEL